MIQKTQKGLDVDLKDLAKFSDLKGLKELKDIVMNADEDSEDGLNLENLSNSELNFTNDQLVKLFKRFKSDLDGKNQSMKFEIEQILSDLNCQYSSYQVDILYKRYNKYILSTINNKDRDYSVLMLKILKSSILSLTNKNMELFYQNNGKIRMIKEKFNSALNKHNFELPGKVFISPIIKKKKLDFNNNFDLGLNNISTVFTELYKVFDQTVRVSETAEKIFKPLIDKLFPTDSNNNSNDSVIPSDTMQVSLKNMIVNFFVLLLNEDKFLKYILLSVKQKNIKVDELLYMEKLICESDDEVFRIERLINKEVKSIFEKIVNNTIKTRKENKQPKTPDNSEVSENDILDLEQMTKLSKGQVNYKLESSRKEKEVRDNTRYNTNNTNSKSKDNSNSKEKDSTRKKSGAYRKKSDNSDCSFYATEEKTIKYKNNEFLISTP